MNAPQLLTWRVPLVEVMNRLPTRAQQGLHFLASALQSQPLFIRHTPQLDSAGCRQASTSSQHVPHRAEHRPIGMLAAQASDPFLANVPLALLGLDEKSKHFRAVSLLSWHQVASDSSFANTFAHMPITTVAASKSSSNSATHGSGRRRKRPITAHGSSNKLHKAGPMVAVSCSVEASKLMRMDSSHNGSGNKGSSNSSSSSTHVQQLGHSADGLDRAATVPCNSTLPHLSSKHSLLKAAAHGTVAGIAVTTTKQQQQQQSTVSEHLHHPATETLEAAPQTASKPQPSTGSPIRVEAQHSSNTQETQCSGPEAAQHAPHCSVPQQAEADVDEHGPLQGDASEEHLQQQVLEFPQDFLLWCRSRDELDVLIKVLRALPEDVDLEDALAHYYARQHEEGEEQVEDRYPYSWAHNTNELAPGRLPDWVRKGDFQLNCSLGEQSDQRELQDVDEDQADTTWADVTGSEFAMDVGATNQALRQGMALRTPVSRGALVFGFWAKCPYG